MLTPVTGHLVDGMAVRQLLRDAMTLLDSIRTLARQDGWVNLNDVADSIEVQRIEKASISFMPTDAPPQRYYKAEEVEGIFDKHNGCITMVYCKMCGSSPCTCHWINTA